MSILDIPEHQIWGILENEDKEDHIEANKNSNYLIAIMTTMKTCNKSKMSKAACFRSKGLKNKFS